MKNNDFKWKKLLLNCETVFSIGRGEDQVQGKEKKRTTIYTIQITYQDKWDVENNRTSKQILTYTDLEEREEFLKDYIKQILEQLKEKE